MKKFFVYLASLVFLSVSWSAMAVTSNPTGFVTPSQLTITFNRISLTDASNQNFEVMSSPVAHTFNRTDTDLVASSLAGVSIPRGRYTAISVCYNTSRSVKLNGDIYNGTSATLTDGATLYTNGSDATAASTVQTSAPGGGATTLSGLVVGSGSENCSSTNFSVPICVAVAADQASTCQTGDTMIDPTVSAPDLQLMLDMYHCVGVDASQSMVDPHVACYPYATLGKPGAAIHIASSAAGGPYGDIELIFGNDKKLAYAAATGIGSIQHFCTGVGAVSVSAGPAGAYVNSYGPTWVMSFDESSGKVQFATGNCGTSSTCTSSGIVTINNVLQPQNTTVTVDCVADTAATPSKLGYTYTAGSGWTSGGTAMTFKISRIVDPNGLFGQCNSTTHNTGYISGSTPSGATGGSCGALP